MKEISQGIYMHSYTVGPFDDEVQWIFPDGFECVDDYSFYEIEYDYHSSTDPCDFSCVYDVTYIRKLKGSFFKCMLKLLIFKLYELIKIIILFIK